MPVVYIIVLSVVGAILFAGNRAKARRRAQFPAPGRLINVGGYRLHLQCQGDGEPVVVIDAGQGDFSLSWAHLLPQLATFTRICTYDRAGLGWSEPSPRPRTAGVMVDELRTLLMRANVPGPYILVGASSGGMNVRLFAHKYPQEVVGLVLVDSAHEDQFSAPVVQEAMRRMRKMMPVMNGALMFLVQTGLVALRPTLLPDGSGAREKLRDADRATFDAIVGGDIRHLATAAAELKHLEETQAELRAAEISSLGDIPLIVLRHGAEQKMMASPEVVAALEETFERLQTGLASLSTRGKLIVAEQSGHAIHLDQPDLVVEAIREVVEAVRERQHVAAESASSH